MRKFLFLDIDGVLCIDGILLKQNVDNLKKVLSLVPDLEVVLISTRRRDDSQCEQIKNLLGVSKIHKTPDLRSSNRSYEINEFLSTVDDKYLFAIVDDDVNLYTYYFNELLTCNKYRGFTEDMVYSVFRLTNNISTRV